MTVTDLDSARGRRIIVTGRTVTPATLDMMRVIRDSAPDHQSDSWHVKDTVRDDDEAHWQARAAALARLQLPGNLTET